MSACSLARPSASRTARSSFSLAPHWLQYRERRWFLQLHCGQRSVNLRLGIATNDPLVPSMIFRSRTTKASSNVTEQNACKRSLLSCTSLMRTSVISTVVLLFSCGTLKRYSERGRIEGGPFLPAPAGATVGRTAPPPVDRVTVR